MDSQNNPVSGAPRPEDDTNATPVPSPEVQVDLATDQPPFNDGTTDSSMPLNLGDAAVPPVTDVPVSPDAQPESPAIAFTTDSNGTVQAVDTPAIDQPADNQPVDGLSQPAADAGASAVAAETVTDTDVASQAPATDQAVVTPPPADPTQPAAPSQFDAPAQGLPPVAPVPVPAKDKRLIVILGVVAIVLLAAIATLVVF